MTEKKISLLPAPVFWLGPVFSPSIIGPTLFEKAELGIGFQEPSRTPFCPCLSRPRPWCEARIDEPWGQGGVSQHVQGCICLHDSLCLRQWKWSNKPVFYIPIGRDCVHVFAQSTFFCGQIWSLRNWVLGQEIGIVINLLLFPVDFAGNTQGCTEFRNENYQSRKKNQILRI